MIVFLLVFATIISALRSFFNRPEIIIPTAPVWEPQPFNWLRDYGPLWLACPSAFWLAPEPKDITPGAWPMPFTLPKPPPTELNWTGVHYSGFRNTTGSRNVFLGIGAFMNNIDGTNNSMFGNQLKWCSLCNEYVSTYIITEQDLVDSKTLAMSHTPGYCYRTSDLGYFPLNTPLCEGCDNDHLTDNP